MSTTRRRSRWVAVLATAGALGLGACSGPNSPSVASLGKSNGHGGGGITTTLPQGNATQLLDEWAACMRSSGDPGQVDPTVDADKVIQVTLPAGYAGGLHGGSCGADLRAAQTALGGSEAAAAPDPVTALRFAQCMRAHGIPDYPDPTGSGQSVIHETSGGDLDPANPAFQAASTLCANKTGFQKFESGSLQAGSINLSHVGGFGGKPGGNGGAGANAGSGSGG